MLTLDHSVAIFINFALFYVLTKGQCCVYFDDNLASTMTLFIMVRPVTSFWKIPVIKMVNYEKFVKLKIEVLIILN